jgi:ABC-type phosphate transport system substrate-binding protein
MMIPRFSAVQHYSPLLLLLPLLMLGGTALAAATDDHDYRHSHAPTFSDPTKLVAVPAGWEAKPIKHLAKYQDADLVVALGQQSYPLFHDLIPKYARANNLKIVVEQGTCGITSGRLLKKKVDVGAFCCPPGKNDRLPGLKFYSLGISPIALIVNPRNTLDNVSSAQAKAIFEGQVSSWSEIDPGNKQFIKPVGRLHCKTRPGHWRALLNSEDDFSPRLFEVGVIPDMMSQVSRSASSVGWETPLMVDRHEKRGKVKMLNIDGHSPSDLDYILTGKYPLYRSYTLTTWTTKSRINDEAVKLIKFLRERIEKTYQEINFLPVSKLREAGWKFAGEELIGEPEMTHHN